MSDSIAKLSVIITGDSSPLGRATQQGAQYVRQFEVQTAGSMTTVGNSAKAMNAAFSVASGNLTKLSGLATFGWVGLIAIAAAAAGKLAFNLALAADAAESKAMGGISEWGREFDRVQAAAGSIADILGRPFLEAATRLTRTFANILEDINTAIMPEWIRQERLATAEKEKQKKLAEELAKKEKEAAEAASKAFQAAQDKAKAAAERISASLRTPAEIYRDTITELNHLFELGLVNVENMTRGIAKARADLVTSMQTASEVKSRMTPSAAITAAERYTSSGQSAVESARRATQEHLALEKAQLQAAQRVEELIKESNRLLRQKGGSGITLANAGLQ